MPEPLQELRACAGAAALMVAAAAPLVGCSAPRLHADMDDAQIRSELATQVSTGASVDEVQRGLDALGVSGRYRVQYAATDARPRVLLTRVFDRKGFWIHGDDDDVEWVDISFVFTAPPEKLERTVLFRDKLRYFHGDPIIYPHAPKRALKARPGRFPAAIPPPADPLEGAE